MDKLEKIEETEFERMETELNDVDNQNDEPILCSKRNEHRLETNIDKLI